MPTYQYRCTECGHDLEAVQKFSDEPLTECPACHGTLRKVYSAVGVVFKGSGFYATDNRKSGSSVKSAGGEPSSSATTDAKPAADGSAPAPKTESSAASSTASKDSK